MLNSLQSEIMKGNTGAYNFCDNSNELGTNGMIKEKLSDPR